MRELIEFIKARLDEGEQIARAATTGPWAVDNPTYAEAILNADGVAVVAGGRRGGEASVFESTEDALHIALHDPDRVLRDIEADRRILAAYEAALAEHDGKGRAWDSDSERARTETSTLAQVVRLRALSFNQHPDYRKEWRP